MIKNLLGGPGGCIAILFFILAFLYFPYGLLIVTALSTAALIGRGTLESQLKKEAWQYTEKVNEKAKLASELENRLKANRKPDDVITFKQCNLKLYTLPSGKTAVRVTLDQRYIQGNFLGQDLLAEGTRIIKRAHELGFLEIADSVKNKKINIPGRNTYKSFFSSISDAKCAIRTGRIAERAEAQIAYLAKEELRLRKKEQEHFLAKAYKGRKEKGRFSHRLDSIEHLYDLSPIQFEKWVGKHIFEKEGWAVEETAITGDGGIDLVIQKGKERSIVQCKRYRKTVGEPIIRDFYGTMLHEGVSRGYFVTTGLFSLPALKFAKDKPIEMIDRRVLAQKYIL